MNMIPLIEAKESLIELAHRVENGETIIVTQDGKPLFEMVPAKKKGGFNEEAARRFLDARGIKDPFPYVAEDFDDPLPEDFLLRPLP
jgi:antitoxin (DNA-binding transcriptional repressor) of toxin-antitoxin stability system